MIFILSVLCIILGIALINKPDIFWELEHFLSVKDGAPTHFYLVVKRVIGVLVVCGGVAGIVVAFIL